ncbi:MAG TPA: GNAT family protein [Candidatus Eremiobacteraceae bacterium]|nr:GNAT family protein [Candidatus Eremiobacteraceae bacterium]
MPKTDVAIAAPRPAGVRVVARTEAHVSAIAAAFNRGDAAASTLYHLPRSHVALSAGYEGGRRHRTIRNFTILRDHEVIGVCSLLPPTFAGVQLAIAIFDAPSRGRGIGRFAVSALCELAFDELRIGRVELGTYPDNHAAIRCYEACGFSREALLRRYIYHDGAWRDLLWMARAKSDSQISGGRR